MSGLRSRPRPRCRSPARARTPSTAARDHRSRTRPCRHGRARARSPLARSRSTAPASSLTSPCSSRPSPFDRSRRSTPAALAPPTTSPCSDPRSRRASRGDRACPLRRPPRGVRLRVHAPSTSQRASPSVHARSDLRATLSSFSQLHQPFGRRNRVRALSHLAARSSVLAPPHLAVPEGAPTDPRADAPLALASSTNLSASIPRSRSAHPVPQVVRCFGARLAASTSARTASRLARSSFVSRRPSFVLATLQRRRPRSPLFGARGRSRCVPNSVRVRSHLAMISPAPSLLLPRRRSSFRPLAGFPQSCARSPSRLSALELSLATASRPLTPTPCDA